MANKRPACGQFAASELPIRGPAAADQVDRNLLQNSLVDFDLWRDGLDWASHPPMRMVDFRRWAMAGAAVALALPLCACISHTRQESAALPQPWPLPPPNLAAYDPPSPDYPSVGGDILKGSSPSDLAAARAAAFHPLDEPDSPGQGQTPGKPKTPPPPR